MPNTRLTLLAATILVSLATASASALPPFMKEWKAKYVEGNPDAGFVEAAQIAKCYVCHEFDSKKKRGDYGKAVGLHLTKAGFAAVAGNPVAAKAYIDGGLTKAEAEKAVSGKTFLERISAGILP
jgi:hypothetical protein